MDKMQLEKTCQNGILETEVPYGGVRKHDQVVGEIESTRETQKYWTVLHKQTKNQRTVHFFIVASYATWPVLPKTEGCW